MFANTQMMGTDMGFPNVCLVPPVMAPVPMPCVAMGPMGVPAAYTILFSCAPTHNMSTSIPLTQGGPPGVAGVASGTVMMKASPIIGAFTCIVGGSPVTRMTGMSVGNMTNCPPTVRLAPSQPKVIILCA